LAFGAEIGAEGGAAEGEEWAEDVAGFGVNAAESGEAGAAEDVGENGFGLVVGSVGYGDAVEFFFGDESIEEGVAGAAGGVFKINFFAAGFCGYIGAGGEKFQIKLLGEGGDEFFVGVGGFTAELVIEVDDAGNETEFRPEFGEKTQQGDGIGAARNGDADAFAGMEADAGSKLKSQGLNIFCHRCRVA
jgi:hypothetical protein